MEWENSSLKSIHLSHPFVSTCSSPTIIISLHLFQLPGQSSAWTHNPQPPTPIVSCLAIIPGVINAWNKLLWQIALNCASMQTVCSEGEGEKWCSLPEGRWWLRFLAVILFISDNTERVAWKHNEKLYVPNKFFSDINITVHFPCPTPVIVVNMVCARIQSMCIQYTTIYIFVHR